MTTRAIDENGDWIFGKGANSYTTELNELKQNIKTKILEWKGDCFFNTDRGIDWLNIIGNKNKASQLQEDINILLNNIEEVINVKDVSILLNNRKLTLSYTIDSTLGGVEGEVIVR